jgi:Na+/citrate or Na+/malate symporter
MKGLQTFMGCMSVLFLAWLVANVLAFILWLLFSNWITGFLTMFAVFTGFGWLLYKVGASIVNNKKEN